MIIRLAILNMFAFAGIYTYNKFNNCKEYNFIVETTDDKISIKINRSNKIFSKVFYKQDFNEVNTSFVTIEEHHNGHQNIIPIYFDEFSNLINIAINDFGSERENTNYFHIIDKVDNVLLQFGYRDDYGKDEYINVVDLSIKCDILN